MLKPLPRSAVRLLPGPLADRRARTGTYLLQLDPDRLLHNFRVNAGLASRAKPLGGWESPGCGLRGHFVGHYLTACAQLYSATGDERFRERLELIIAELATVQAALPDGYLSAFPISQFDLLEQGVGGSWAPYYTLHKILAGLIEAHREAAIEAALPMAKRLGDWIVRRMQQVPAEALEKLLETSELNPLNEYGGVGEALYDLFELTGTAAYRDTAMLFDRSWFLQPLMEQRDQLAGLHANTHIPQVLAAARRYELTGDARYRQAAEYFWTRVAGMRSYITGGSSGPRPDRRERSDGGEHWPDAGKLHGTLTSKINESCVVNNMLRLCDVLFRWGGDRQYAEFRERGFHNSILAMQHHEHCGQYIYSHPLAPGSRKVFGDPDATFWCCYGTTIEAYARLGDGIYFTDDQSLSVAQFIASEAAWADRGLRLTQTTDFPREQATRLRIDAATGEKITIKVRAPSWSTAATCEINGERCAEVVDGWFTLERRWKAGDLISVQLPMSLHTERLAGDALELGFLYGPIVLAARTPHALELGVAADRAVDSVRPTDASRLQFTARLSFGGDVPLTPVSEIGEETYGVYFKTTG